MFLVGEAESVVRGGKAALPSEYRLRKKKLLFMWKDERTGYLGETRGALRFAAGTEGPVTDVEIDSENRLPLKTLKDGQRVRLSGCVSTLEVSLIGR